MKVTCFGEILMDHFPTGKVAGGAPMNVAVWLQKLGLQSYVISKVGKDEDGDYLLEFLKQNGLSTSFIHTDDVLPSGYVEVYLKDGSATYNIHYPVAWDRITLSQEKIELVKESAALVYGSLASRDEVSRSSLIALMNHADFKVFDVNLRPPHYSMEILDQYIMSSNLIKFNDEEIYEIGEHYSISKNKSMEYHIEAMADITQTESICVTKGKHGAVLFYQNTMYHFAGFHVVVKDTVGAGDSFLGGMLSQLLMPDSDPEFALRYGCAIGAYVASQKGANPEFNESFFKEKFRL